MLPDRLIDNTIKVDHKLYELVCIPLRILIALYFILLFEKTNTKDYKSHSTLALLFIILLSIFIILGFSYKLYKHSKEGITHWKNYSKTIIIYLIIFVISASSYYNPENMVVNMKIVGVLILLDVLMGQNNKFIANLLK
jgi:hypothetical protein